jgi:hypothetical protein
MANKPETCNYCQTPENCFLATQAFEQIPNLDTMLYSISAGKKVGTTEESARAFLEKLRATLPQCAHPEKSSLAIDELEAAINQKWPPQSEPI